MDKAKKKLKKYFGYDNFYPFQEKVIKEVLKKKDLFVLAKTSGGKSLCYQIPALIYKGLTIIISPLRSLIDDQVNNLKKKEINCLAFYGDLNKVEKEFVINELDNKTKLRCHILYTTPETLESNVELFQLLVRLYEKNLLARFVIDEVHTLSLWGHNFRKSYLILKELKNKFKNVPITALTATATYCIQKDILNILQIEHATVVRDKLFRNNLNIIVRLSHTNKDREILNHILSNYKNKTGIIFCLTQKKCEQYSEYLQKNKISANYYHADMTKADRQKTQDDWINNKLNVIVATIAFGMGIDKSDVRFVIHYNTPSSIEGYYQEIGRAGRDNQLSECILYYDSIDINIHKGMIASSKNMTCEYKSYQISKLNDIQEYSNNIHDCRHQILCINFGEKLKKKCSSICDNCNRNKEDIYIFNFSKIAKKIIYIITRFKTRVDKETLIKKMLVRPYFNLKYGYVNLNVIKRIFVYLLVNDFIDIEIINIDDVWCIRYIPSGRKYDDVFDFKLPFYTKVKNDYNKIFYATLENNDPNITYIDISTEKFLY